MLKCKNDPKRTYKGTEPSPKGLGYCAHNMKVDTIKKGKDGNKWIVKKIKNGSKRWVKIKDESLKKIIINNKNKNSLITKTKPKIGKGKEINIKDNNDNQLYLHFNELEDVSILNKIKNTKLTQNKGKLIVRWFDYYTYKNYNSSISLKQALKIFI